MPSEPLVASIIVRRVVEKACVALGVDRAALLGEAGVPAAALSPTRLRLPWSTVEDLLEAAEGLTGDDRVGFHLAVRGGFQGSPTISELLFMACPTIGDAIRRVHPVTRLWGDAEEWSLHDGGIRHRYTVRSPPRRAHVHLHEHGLAMPMMAIRAACGAQVSPLVVRFAHPRDDVDAYEAFFGCPVHFGAGVTEVVLRAETLALPVVSSNPLFARHFERAAVEELGEPGSARRLCDRLRAALSDDLAGHRLAVSSLETCATRLGTSARTLQRGLAEEGTTFAAELDTLRRDAAEHMLLAGTDIAEISWRLGYAEPPVFHRAFKRWTGDTPEGWRRRRSA